MKTLYLPPRCIVSSALQSLESRPSSAWPGSTFVEDPPVGQHALVVDQHDVAFGRRGARAGLDNVDRERRRSAA